MVAFSGPGIGKQNEYPCNSLCWQRRQNIARIACMNTDITQALRRNRFKQMDNAVYIGLAADETDLGIRRSKPCQMAAIAKANFQPYFADRMRK